MSQEVPTALEAYFQAVIQSNGTGPQPLPNGVMAFPRHPILNIVGGTVTEDVPNNRINITVSGTGPPSGPAGGDLEGTFPNPGVAQLQGVPVSVTAPTAGQVLTDVGGIWTPQTPSAGSGGWQTALDLDFTAQTTQSLATDGNYTIAGLTWTKFLSSKDRVAMALTSGTGLVITPSSTAAFNGGTARNCPLLQLPLSQLGIATLDWRTSLRIWVKATATSLATSGDQLAYGLGTLNSLLAGLNAIDSILFWGRGGTINAEGLQLGHAFNNSFIDLSSQVGATLASNAVSVLEGAPLNMLLFSLYGAFGAGPGWPDPGTLGPGNTANYVSANSSRGNASGQNVIPPLSGMALTLGAQAADSTTAFTVQRLRVDYKS